MFKTFLEQRRMFNILKENPKPEIENKTSFLPKNLQIIKQKINSGNNFLVKKRTLKISN